MTTSQDLERLSGSVHQALREYGYTEWEGGIRALRLARVLGMSADFWLGLQMDWDLWHAMKAKDAAEIAGLKPVHRTA